MMEQPMRYGRLLLIAVLSVLPLGACNHRSAEAANDSTAGKTTANVPQEKADDGVPFEVASDPNASYRLLKWSRMKNGNIEAVTVREGPYERDFARKEINCRSRTYRGLGEGE